MEAVLEKIIENTKLKKDVETMKKNIKELKKSNEINYKKQEKTKKLLYKYMDLYETACELKTRIK